MSISADQRYYLKQKALFYFYEKGYSNTDIAKMLGISRVTLNRLMAEAKEEGMVRIEIIDTKNLQKLLNLEDKIKNFYGLKYVKLVDINSTDPETVTSKLAAEGAKHLDRYLHSGMKIGIGWGNTLSSMVNLMTPNSAVSNLEIYTLLGGACSEANFQPNLLAQRLIINAPFVCHSYLLCSEIKKEPSIANILRATSSLDIAVVGIGREPNQEHLEKSYYHFPPDIIEEIIKAGAVGDICGNFFDENGRICKTSVADRVVSIDIHDLKQCSNVIAVAGGPAKARSIRGALNGGFINVLITDTITAAQLLP